MPLTIDPRFAGNIYILHCDGSIVLGPETKSLEAAFELAVSHGFSRLLLSVRQVTRVDSIGVGLIVRFAERLRRRGGDIRLAENPEFLTKLLELTQLSKIILSFPTEEDAILSYLRQPPPEAAGAVHGPRVLFIDESPDLGIFVRSILSSHGYDVQSHCLLRDAKLLLQVNKKVDYILAGPGTYSRPAATVLASLKPLAPRATALRLDDNFKTLDAQQATGTLLQLFHPPPAN